MDSPQPQPASPQEDRSTIRVTAELDPNTITVATLPDNALSTYSLQLAGFRDSFFEQRHSDQGQLDFLELSGQSKISFLSRVTHVDELYEVRENSAIQPGLYRIRDEGAPCPLVTLKAHGKDSHSHSSTHDIVDPGRDLINAIEEHGKLVAVVEKVRVSYKSRKYPDCLIHHDTVSGLGEFYDVKADSLETMESFVGDLGLSKETEIHQSYLQQKKDKGISQLQLKFWKFHQKFEDYVIGVVSGTLTPLGFLTTTAAIGGDNAAMVASLLVSGLADGLSDAVATSQTVASKSDATFGDQLKLFGKTMLGKAAVPMTFLPCVFLSSSNVLTVAMACAWATALLSSTATVQAVAKERSPIAEVGKLTAIGLGITALGAAIGTTAAPLANFLGSFF